VGEEPGHPQGLGDAALECERLDDALERRSSEMEAQPGVDGLSRPQADPEAALRAPCTGRAWPPQGLFRSAT
jgi:hypothetical protein